MQSSNEKLLQLKRYFPIHLVHCFNRLIHAISIGPLSACTFFSHSLSVGNGVGVFRRDNSIKSSSTNFNYSINTSDHQWKNATECKQRKTIHEKINSERKRWIKNAHWIKISSAEIQQNYCQVTWERKKSWAAVFIFSLAIWSCLFQLDTKRSEHGYCMNECIVHNTIPKLDKSILPIADC